MKKPIEMAPVPAHLGSFFFVFFFCGLKSKMVGG